MQCNLANNSVEFHSCDMRFVKKFGIFKAAEMVLDYKRKYDFPFLYDIDQLADWLRISRTRLFRLTNHVYNKYYSHIIKKKNGEVRRISEPSPLLKYIQQRICREILRKYAISEYATAYHKGATLYKNAQPHCGKKNILKMDLKNFFGSIRFETVYRTVFNSNYFPKQIGVMLTALCCKNDVLPQGAPTSPAISNIVMKHFDDVMGNWCKKHGIVYTRYCDDMTFSGNSNLCCVYRKAKDFLENMGFVINEKKTRFVSQGSRQQVTGIVVNEFPQASKEYRRRLRQELYYVHKFGVGNVVKRNDLTQYLTDYGKVLRFKYLFYLQGKVNYVLQIDPNNKEFRAESEKLAELMRKYHCEKYVRKT